MFLAHPWILWLLAPLFVLWVAGWLLVQRYGRIGSRRRSAAVQYSDTRPLARMRPAPSVRARRIVQGLRIVALGLLAIAMARPQTGRSETRVITEGIDIVLVVDTSGSMRALDLDADKPIARRATRLEVVKDVVERFIKRRENDQIGMVVFGTQAFTQCPLTLDHGIVSTFLSKVEIGMAGEATAVGDALGVAVKRLQKSKAKSKVIVLLTDGRNNTGTLGPREAAEVAKTLGVKVYTIGAGTRGKAPFIVDTLFGKQVVYQDTQVEIDEDTLREVATSTGGAYFRAVDAQALAGIYDQIDRLERTEITMNKYQEYNERFGWFVLPALGLVALELMLLGTRLRKVP